MYSKKTAWLLLSPTLFILGVGVVTKISVKKALIDIRHNELSNMINSNQLTMNVWIEEQKKLVEILDKNNLIESSYIRKVYPDLLSVNINKADFLAIMNQGTNKFIIASNGKLISLNDVDFLPQKLPFVFGKVSNEYFINLKKIIDDSKFDYKEIEAFYFHRSNRIDIKTKGGFLIKLPYKNLPEALRVANLIKKDDKFKNNKILDLRITNHIITSNE